MMPLTGPEMGLVDKKRDFSQAHRKRQNLTSETCSCYKLAGPLAVAETRKTQVAPSH